jgi:hypothetical protein
MVRTGMAGEMLLVLIFIEEMLRLISQWNYQLSSQRYFASFLSALNARIVGLLHISCI